MAARAGLTRESVYGGLEKKRFIIETNGAGAAFLDADGDGWVDALVLNGTRLEEGTRREAAWPWAGRRSAISIATTATGPSATSTAQAGFGKTGFASSVCAGDYDNDGALDLFVTYFGRNVLYRNLGAASVSRT